jgi:hypothetical protein
LREEDRRWRATVVELQRELDNYIRLSRDRQTIIRALEERLRRLGYGGFR